MNKLLILFLSLMLTVPAYAEELQNNTEQTVEVAQENTNEAVKEGADEAQVSVENSEAVKVEDINTEGVKQPEFEIVRVVEKEITPMPACDDEQLFEKTKEYITAYFDKTKNEGTLYRRRRHFILKGLDKFEKENIANYKTSATRPVSDIIADVKINKSVVEENMQLCKNKSLDEYAGKIYLLIYPQNDEYEVQIINLAYKQNSKNETSFSYKK